MSSECRDVKEIRAKSILRKQRRVDSWFLSGYGMNLYRGCTHDCVYCDGRSEGYYVAGDFGKEVAAKVNAPEILEQELDPKRKRKPLRKSYLMIGGGVGDAYQPVESHFGLARQCLQVIAAFDFPVHVLTKSCLVERDLDVISDLSHKSGAMVSMSFSTVDDAMAAIFEPGTPPPSRRLETLTRFGRAGIAVGMYLMPVIPCITDTPACIDAAVRRASEVGLDFVVFGGMTLKRGRQWDYYMSRLMAYRPDLVPQYHALYPESPWGSADPAYYASATQLFHAAAKAHGVNERIPPRLYRDILDENDRVIVMLEHLDYFNRACGRSSPYRNAARAVANSNTPLSTLPFPRTLTGVGHATGRIISEILETGRCQALDAFLW